jgi:hypothetical protein
VSKHKPSDVEDLDKSLHTVLPSSFLPSIQG